MSVKNLATALTRILAPPSRAMPSRRRQKPTRRQNRARATTMLMPSRPRTVTNPSWGRSLPAAYASHVRPRFNVATRSATGAVVSGCDLVYPLPNMVATDTDYLFAVIPSNPAYWAGTRIAQFAPAYMNYRPIAMTFSYIPQVAVTQPGTVFMGTLWNGAAITTNLQQTLVTSNGGCLTQCYVPCDTKIQLGTNLQMNLFTMSGDLNPTTSPFIFLAGVRGADVVPGYFYVTYTYEFKNPIGQSWLYGNSGQSTVSEISSIPRYGNRSLVLLEGVSGFGPGTILDVEGNDSLYYRGSPVTLPATTNVLMLYNEQSSKAAGGLQSSTVITMVKVYDAIVPLSTFTPVASGAPMSYGANSTLIKLSVVDGVGTMLVYRHVEAGTVTATTAGVYYVFSSLSPVYLLNAAGVTISSVIDASNTDDVPVQVNYPMDGLVRFQL